MVRRANMGVSIAGGGGKRKRGGGQHVFGLVAHFSKDTNLLINGEKFMTALAEALKLLSERKRLANEDPVEDAEWLFSALSQYTGAELRELLYTAQEPDFFELMGTIFKLDELSRQALVRALGGESTRSLTEIHERLKKLRRLGELRDASIVAPEKVERLGSFARFLEIQTLANRVFGDEKATAWLNRTNSALSGQKPIDLLRDELGAAVVREALEQIDHGIFA